MGRPIYGYMRAYDGTSEAKVLKDELHLFRWAQLEGFELAVEIERAELIVSELVTNAVKETGLTDPSPDWETVRAQHIIGV